MINSAKPIIFAAAALMGIAALHPSYAPTRSASCVLNQNRHGEHNKLGCSTIRFPGERGAHSLVNADGSLLSAYHLREHSAARDRVCAGNAWIEIGRSARESAFAAGRSPMKQRVVPMLMPTGGSTGPNAAERNSQFGARRPGDVSHCSMWTAVSACRALRSSRSRSMPGGVPRASFRRRCAWSVKR